MKVWKVGCAAPRAVANRSLLESYAARPQRPACAFLSHSRFEPQRPACFAFLVFLICRGSSETFRTLCRIFVNRERLARHAATLPRSSGVEMWTWDIQSWVGDTSLYFGSRGIFEISRVLWRAYESASFVQNLFFKSCSRIMEVFRSGNVPSQS